MGPSQGMSDRARAAEALMKENIVLAEDLKKTKLCGKHGWVELTCINSQHIWIIDTIDRQQVTKDLHENTQIQDVGDRYTLFFVQKVKDGKTINT